MNRKELLERKLELLEDIEEELGGDEDEDGEAKRSDILDFYVPRVRPGFYLSNQPELRRLIWPFGGGR